MDIEGLGRETAEALVDHGLVRQLPDLYRLTAADLMTLDGFAVRSAGKLITAIGGSRRAPLRRFIFALGVPLVGAAMARDLAERFGTLAAFREASLGELRGVPGIGERTAVEVHEFLHQKRIGNVLDDLERAGVRPVPERGGRGGGPLAGKTFVFTGTLEGYTRSEAGRLVEARGGRVSDAVSATTDYVVVGSDPGEKAREAEARGVRRIGEKQFEKLVTNNE
jgi:DNA ligase (NAD+)